MPKNFSQVRAAVVQAAPILFDREATIKKTCYLTAEAAGQGAKLILFPEAFIPMGESGLSMTDASPHCYLRLPNKSRHLSSDIWKHAILSRNNDYSAPTITPSTPFLRSIPANIWADPF